MEPSPFRLALLAERSVKRNLNAGGIALDANAGGPITSPAA